MGLDIYAMGMILLEIGPWKSAEMMEVKAYERQNHNADQDQQWTDNPLEAAKTDLCRCVGKLFRSLFRRA